MLKGKQVPVPLGRGGEVLSLQVYVYLNSVEKFTLIDALFVADSISGNVVQYL